MKTKPGAKNQGPNSKKIKFRSHDHVSNYIEKALIFIEIMVFSRLSKGFETFRDHLRKNMLFEKIQDISEEFREFSRRFKTFQDFLRFIRAQRGHLGEP